MTYSKYQTLLFTQYRNETDKALMITIQRDCDIFNLDECSLVAQTPGKSITEKDFEMAVKELKKAKQKMFGKAVYKDMDSETKNFKSMFDKLDKEVNTISNWLLDSTDRTKLNYKNSGYLFKIYRALMNALNKEGENIDPILFDFVLLLASNLNLMDKKTKQKPVFLYKKRDPEDHLKHIYADTSANIEMWKNHIDDMTLDIINPKLVLMADGANPTDLFSKIFRDEYGNSELEFFRWDDPLGVNDNLLIIPDKKKFAPTRLTHGTIEELDYYRELICSMVVKVFEDFGAKNVIVFTQNKKIADWLNECYNGYYDDTLITWYRSTMSEGIKCSRRICLLIGLPYSQTTSHIIFEKMMSDRYDIGHKEMRKLENSRALKQSMSRCIDPNGKRSAVILFGGKIDEFNRMVNLYKYPFQEDDGFNVHGIRRRGNLEGEGITMAKLWLNEFDLDHNVDIDAFSKFASYIIDNRRNGKADISRSIRNTTERNEFKAKYPDYKRLCKAAIEKITT